MAKVCPFLSGWMHHSAGDRGDGGESTGGQAQGSTKSLVALALLADKLKSHGQILTKITYILYEKVFDTDKDCL